MPPDDKILSAILGAFLTSVALQLFMMFLVSVLGYRLGSWILRVPEASWRRSLVNSLLASLALIALVLAEQAFMGGGFFFAYLLSLGASVPITAWSFGTERDLALKCVALNTLLLWLLGGVIGGIATLCGVATGAAIFGLRWLFG